jgi:hypothetical protein
MVGDTDYVENVPLAVGGAEFDFAVAAEEQAALLSDKALAGWLQENVRSFPYFRIGDVGD